ncbi:MAG: hypothetical protein IKK99_06405 [Oscillospiraceae bacterium]|nr:hypothetical protein [Oscillospiraceae bacterium]
MTFESLKRKLKLHRRLIYIYLVIAFSGSLLFRVRKYNVATHTLANIVGSVAGIMIFSISLIGVIYSLHYIATHTRCIKCKNQIDLKTFLKMERFKCPHCGFERFNNDKAEIWFK